MPHAITISLTNRQRTRRLDIRLLKKIARALLADQLQLISCDLGLCLMGAAEMARINEDFVHHQGSTDVITFDYGSDPEARVLHGELFICVDEALLQARRFRVSWQSEVVRYLVHGALHLLGHDDLKPGPRRLMKREENRLVRELARSFPLDKIHVPSHPGTGQSHHA
jgi:probable rRNA maturation factor